MVDAQILSYGTMTIVAGVVGGSMSSFFCCMNVRTEAGHDDVVVVELKEILCAGSKRNLRDLSKLKRRR